MHAADDDDDNGDDEDDDEMAVVVTYTPRLCFDHDEITIIASKQPFHPWENHRYVPSGPLLIGACRFMIDGDAVLCQVVDLLLQLLPDVANAKQVEWLTRKQIRSVN